MTIDRRVSKSKHALKQSLTTLMNQKTFKNITISEIVELADLNRGTFYKHYQDKEDLLNDLIQDVLSDFTESYRAPYQNKSAFYFDQLNASAIKIFDHVAKYSNFYTIVINDDALPGFVNKLGELLKELVITDHMKDFNTPSIDRQLMASYQSYAILGLIIEWVKGGFIYTPSYMATQLLNILSVELPHKMK
ncbi:TetR/AcrR family transcriptional regulator [Pradoshia sp.]